jgi:hypothetical protein
MGFARMRKEIGEGCLAGLRVVLDFGEQARNGEPVTQLGSLAD